MDNLIKIGNQEVLEIKWNNERVITTAQLADVYKTDVNNVQANFGRNQEHFAEGKHYYLLKGNELKDFKHYLTDSQLVAKNAPCLYLWTRRGASRHCKILDTDRAWEQFDCLKETYFNKKKPLSATEQLRLQSQAIGEIDERVTSIDNDLQNFKQDMPILGIEESKITDAVKCKGVQCLGGKIPKLIKTGH